MADFEEQDLNEFISACAKRFCPHCGKPIEPSGTGRTKIYCCNNHRWAEWKKRKRRKKRLGHESCNTENNTGIINCYSYEVCRWYVVFKTISWGIWWNPVQLCISAGTGDHWLNCQWIPVASARYYVAKWNRKTSTPVWQFVHTDPKTEVRDEWNRR